MNNYKYAKAKKSAKILAGSNRAIDASALSAERGVHTVTEWFRIIYAYNKLEKFAQWAKKYRAGIILVRDIGGEKSVLFVQEASVGGALGFPKGGRETADESAFDTAVRELREETGVDLEELPARFIPHCVATCRSEIGVEQVSLFFVAVIGYDVKVTISGEISYYRWISVADVNRGLPGVTANTRAIIRDVENMLQWL